MTKKNIAVTMRYDYFYNRKELRNGIDFNLINWIYKLGFTPHLVPNDLRYFNTIKKKKIHGFILSGGNDTNLKKTRTILENKILYFSKKKKIPVLGICHGMQIMNKFAEHYREHYEVLCYDYCYYYYCYYQSHSKKSNV